MHALSNFDLGVASIVALVNVTTSFFQISTFANNFAESAGASLLVQSSKNFVLASCSFTGDRSDSLGGSVFFLEGEEVSLGASTFTNISAPNDAAISALEYGSVNIESSDFVNCTGRDAASMYSHL